MLNLQEMRTDYKKASLDKSSVPVEPFELFETWFSQAQDAQIKDPNTMILATSSEENIPNLRAVLLKIFDKKGSVPLPGFWGDYRVVPHADRVLARQRK